MKNLEITLNKIMKFEYSVEWRGPISVKYAQQLAMHTGMKATDAYHFMKNNSRYIFDAYSRAQSLANSLKQAGMERVTLGELGTPNENENPDSAYWVYLGAR